MSKRGCSPIRRLTAHMGRYLLLLLGLGLAVHILLPQAAVLERSLQVLRTMKWWAVGLAMLGQMLSFLGSGYLQTALAAIFGHRLSLVRSTIIFTAAGSIGLLGGGLVGNTAVTYHWLRGSGVSAEGAVIAGWMPVLLGNGLLVLISILGLAHLIAVHELTRFQVIGFGLLLLLLFLVTGGTLWGMRHRAQFTGLFVRISGWWARLRHRSPNPAPAQAAVEQLFDAWHTLRAGGWRGTLLGNPTKPVLPTGRLRDEIDGHEVTLVDNGMPVVLLRAADVDVAGGEAPSELESREELRAALESIRLQAGPLLGLGDVAEQTVPKLVLLSAGRDGGAISTRTFIPHRVHSSIGVLMAASVAAGIAIPGTVADGLAELAEAERGVGGALDIEHPSGHFVSKVRLATDDVGRWLGSSTSIRTARKLFDGRIFPRS